MPGHDTARSAHAAHHDGPTNLAAVRRGTGRRLGVSVGVIVVLLAAAFVVVHSARSRSSDELATATREIASQPPTVVAVPASRAAASASLSLPGTTAAWYESTIYARVSGYVGKWFVDIGDRVKKGQVLATIETPEIDAELISAQAKLKSAQAEVGVRQAQADFAKTTYQRWRDSPKGVVSEQERESKKADYDSAVAQLNAAQADVNTDKGEVERLLALTQFKQVVAPYDGTITERHIDIGNLVTAGSTTATSALYRMSQDDPIRVFVDVPQAAASDMTVGLPASVAVRGMPGHPFAGRITRTAEALDPNARTLRVEVDIPNADGSLVPGLYADVDFQLKAKGLAQVPASALVFRPEGPAVAIITRGQQVEFRNVQIARDDGNIVEIASGLSPGDKVVLNISSEVTDGEKVTVADETPASAPSPDLAHARASAQ